jgi:hypothetical protein
MRPSSQYETLGPYARLTKIDLKKLGIVTQSHAKRLKSPQFGKMLKKLTKMSSPQFKTKG